MTEPRQSIRFTASSDGTRIAFALAGKGPALVRAPSLFTHVDYDWESATARHWITELSDRRTYLRLDPRGVGASQPVVDEISFETVLQDLEAAVDAAGFDRFDLFGMSMGPAIAIAYAARHPDRVGRLLLWGAYCRGTMRRSPTPEQRARSQLYLQLAELGWDQADPAFRLVFVSELMPGASKEQWCTFSEELRQSVGRDTAARYWRMAAQIDICDLARQVAAPTLVMHAKGDRTVPVAEGQLTAALIPRAEFVAVDSDNHLLLADEPAWPRVVTEIRRFLPGGPDIDVPATFAGLSHRERQVLELVARGMSNDEIAGRLCLSRKTIGNHVTNVYAKLAVCSRAQAIVLARNSGLGMPS